MRTAIRLALLLACIWAAAELTLRGPSGAFGGLLSSWNDPSPPRSPDRPPRAAEAFQRAYDKSGARVDALLAGGEAE